MGLKGERIWEKRLTKLITKGKTPYMFIYLGCWVNVYGSSHKPMKIKELSFLRSAMIAL